MPADAERFGTLRPVALAALGGLIVAFSMPPWGFWPLAFVGIGLLASALDDRLTRRQRALVGFTFAATWMYPAMAWMWFLTVPGYVVAIILFALSHAAAAAWAPTGRWGRISRPAAHTLAEIVRFSFPFGGVPLASLGISQAGGPLLGVARLGGVILLTWLVFQVGFAVAWLLNDHWSWRPIDWRSVEWAALATVAGVVALSTVAPSGFDLDADPVDIAAVQGGGEQGTSALEVPSRQVTLAHLAATATIDPDPDLDLVVWPENGIDVNREPFEGSDAQLAVATEATRLGVPFTVGVTLDSEFSQFPTTDSFVNAQVMITPDGEVTDVYEKVHIVPFGEYVPFRGVLEALGAPLDKVAGDATRGRGEAVIDMPDDTRLGVMISWEVFFGHRGRAARDGEILLNPTNGASYTGTILQTQQVASSRLRAIETGRWVVQVSPTGFSAFVSPQGEVFQRTEVSEQRVIRMDVPRRGGTTWYTQLGDRPWIWLVVAVLALTAFASWRHDEDQHA